MSLKEKFTNAIVLPFEYEKKIQESLIIANEFAKEVLRVYISNKTLQYKQNQGDYSLDELLEIIKKEL
jgi:hypothetical protein